MVSLGVILLFILDAVLPFTNTLSLLVSAAPAVISNPKPADSATGQLTRPSLSVTVSFTGTMRVVFSEYADGAWYTIQEFTNVVSGTYSVVPNKMVELGTMYQWRVEVYDGAALSASQTYSLTTTSTVLTRKWTSSLAAPSEAGVLIGDINNDGLQEIVKAGTGKIIALRGQTGALIWTYTDPLISTECKPAIADLDKDGKLEIVVPLQGGGGIQVLNSDGTEHKNYQGLSMRIMTGGMLQSNIVVADIDGDGYPTIFVDTAWSNTAYDNGVLSAISWDGRVLNQRMIIHPCAGGLSIADTDHDGVYELYMCDRNEGYNPGSGNGVQSYWAGNLTMRWTQPSILCSSNCPMIVDANNDGKIELVIGNLNGGIYILDPDTGNIIRATPGNYYNTVPTHYQASIYDIDQDGHLEFICADGSHTSRNPYEVVVWDLVDWKQDWKNDKVLNPLQCYLGPQEADVTGDGIMEMIICTYTDLFIYDHNFQKIAEDIGVSNSVLSNGVAQDIDGDGYTELVVSSMGNQIIAYDTPARTPAIRPRSEVRFYSESRLGAAEYVPLADVQPLLSDTSPYNGATDIPATQTSISFNLRDDQGGLMSYTVTTNPNIGSGSASGLTNGRYSVPISGLAPNTAYQWTITATDGTHPITRTFTFKTMVSPLWYDIAWPYRKTITVFSAYVDGSQVNFPLILDITDTDLAAKAKSDGSDIFFTSAKGVKLDHQIESYSNGHLVAWVRLPTLSIDKDTAILMYYGNSGATSQANPSAVWDSGSRMVLHLDAQTLDSTVNSNNGSSQGGVTKGVAGVVGSAYTLDGSTGFIQVPSSSTVSGFTSSLTVSLWVKFQDVNRRQTLVSKFAGTDQKSFFLDYWNAQSTFGKVLYFSGSVDGVNTKDWYCQFSPTANTWYYVVVVWTSGGVPMFFVNGSQVATVVSGGGNMGRLASLFQNDATDLAIGKSWDASTRFLRGTIDEVRISGSIRNAARVKAEYLNIVSPGTFYKKGAEEGIPDVPLVFSPDPADGSITVKTTQSKLSFTLLDPKGHLMSYTVTTSPNIGSGSGSGVTNGVYSVSVSGLDAFKAYSWTVSVTDGTTTTTVTYSFTTTGPLLVDSTFDASVDSVDLRSNGPGQDWYESRNNVPTDVFLDVSNIGGNAGKKAGFIADSAGNAYLTQEFASPITGTFSAQWDIYIDSILSTDPNRAGLMMIGYDSGSGPNRASSDKLVYMDFYKLGGGTSGTMDFRALTSSGTPTTIVSGLNLKQWYTVKVVVDVTTKSYDIYVNGVLKGSFTNSGFTGSAAYISFAQWNDGAGDFYVDNVYAPVREQYTLTVTTSGNGSVTKNPDQANYYEGDSVQLTAVPASNWSFAGWSGDASGTTNPTTVTINGNKAVTATFTQIEYTVTVTVSPSAGGTVTKSPSKSTYHYGDVVTLTESPSTGYSFSAWSGDGTGTGSTRSITVTGNMDVTATFTQNTNTITVTSPNGGESWIRGTAHTITWTSIGSPGSYVKIELLKAGVVNRIISSSAANTGSYSWTIPSFQATGSDYTIRITSTTKTTVTDTSNANFAIIIGALTVTSPNGGEIWIRGTAHTITWASIGSPGSYVKIELLKAGVVTRVISSSAANTGSYSWTIPTTQVAGSDYTIRITSTSNTGITDTSNANFAIIIGALTVTSPNGGESWIRGTAHTITWTSNDSPGSYVKIELLKAGVVTRVISSSAANTGSYSWTISSFQAAGSDYTIRITSTSNTAITDTSNANFAITT